MLLCCLAALPTSPSGMPSARRPTVTVPAHQSILMVSTHDGNATYLSSQVDEVQVRSALLFDV